MDRATLIAAMAATAAAAPVSVETKEWGTLYVRAVTVGEVDEQDEKIDAASKDKNRFARAACRVLCDESGQRVFDAANVDDVALLANQPWHLLRKVLDAGNKGEAGNE